MRLLMLVHISKMLVAFFAPFTPKKPEKALQGKKMQYEDGGDLGNREDEISELIAKMN